MLKLCSIALGTVLLLMGCNFWFGGGAEAEAPRKAGERVLYYQLSGEMDKGWQLADEDRLREVENLVVVSSTMLGYRRKLHFDRLLPLKTEYLKTDNWHLISFNHRESTSETEEAAEAAETGGVLTIQLEWLTEQGEVGKASVEVKNPKESPPTRDVFDELFGLYVGSVVASHQRAAQSTKQAQPGADAAPKADAGGPK